MLDSFVLGQASFGELAGIGTFFGIFAVVFLGIMLVSLGLYVVQAIALMKISDNVGFDKGWLAWVPIANSFVMPMLVEDEVHESMRGKFTLIFGISFGVSIFFSALIPFLALVPAALVYYAFYIIASWYSENAIIHVVLAVFTAGISLPFSLLRFSNRTKRSEVEVI